MRTHVILLSGKQGSGKSSLQQELIWALRARSCTHAVAVNFADVLYEMHNAVLAVLHKYLPVRPIVKDGPLLQLLGTEWGRKNLGESVWIDCTRSAIDRIEKQCALHRDGSALKNLFFIVGDCRFENEFHAFEDAVKIRLFASETVRKSRCSMWRDNTAHPSETSLDEYENERKFDLQINTGTHSVSECVDKILKLMESKK